MTKPDPTSPAGMSKADIRVELAEEHGINMKTTKDHPDLVGLLIQARLTTEAKAEREAKGTPVLGDPEYAEVPGARIVRKAKAPAPVVEDEDDDMLEDFDDEPEPAVEVVVADERGPEGYEPGDVVDVIFPDPDSLGFIEYDVPEVEDQVVWTSAEFDALERGWVAGEDIDVASLMDEIDHAQPAPLFIGMPGTLDYLFDGHAGAGPSGAERWMNCTASLGAVREFLETLSPGQQRKHAEAGMAARQGTTAHAIGESEVLLRLGQITAEEHDNTVMELTLEPIAGEAYDEEMAEYLTEYTDYVQSFIDAGHEVHVEQRVMALVPLTVQGAYAYTYEDGDTLEDYYGISGSVDLSVMPIPTHNRLTVGDLKYGQGIDVDVEGNPQIRIYALAILALLADAEGNLPELDGIDYAIVQPRMGGLKTWTESVDDLLTWRDEVLAPALTAALGLAPSTFEPSDLACQWCPVRGSCPALTDKRVKDGALLFDAIVEAEVEGHDISTGLPNKSSISNERLGALLSQIDGLVGLKDDLKEEAQRRLHRGDEVPGYHLVNYTPARHWAEGVEAKVGKLPIWKPRTLFTPTQALKIMGDEEKHKIEEFIVAPDKRPVIAKIGGGNRNKPWTGVPPEQMFPDLKEGE